MAEKRPYQPGSELVPPHKGGRATLGTIRPSVAMACSACGVQGWPKLSRRQLENPPWLENIGPGAMLIWFASASR